MTTDKDLLDQLAEANAHLKQIHSDDIRLNGMTDTISQTLDNIKQQGQTLLSLQAYANETLTHLTKQADTIICILEKSLSSRVNCLMRPMCRQVYRAR